MIKAFKSKAIIEIILPKDHNFAVIVFLEM